MKNCPVQVVLQTDNFIVANARPAGGGNKDFYEGDDLAFVKHRNYLLTQLETVRSIQNRNPYSSISYAKVILKPSALAKSHRPTRSLFNDRTSRVVGGGDLGEIFVEIRKNSIQELIKKLENVETKTNWFNLNDKKTPKPSRLRSEIGGISNIRPYSASDKRKFSIEEGVNWFLNSRAGGSYLVELFEPIPTRQNWDNLDIDKLRMLESFFEGIISLNINVTLSNVSESNNLANIIAVSLLEGISNGTVGRLQHVTKFKRRDKNLKISFDKETHMKLIGFLEVHPLVKKITLPSFIKGNEMSTRTSNSNLASLPIVEKDAMYPTIGIIDGGVAPILDDWVIDRLNVIVETDKNLSHGTFIAGQLISSSSINGKEVFDESDGCWIVDLDVYPEESKYQEYYYGSLDFFDELRSSIPEMKSRTGVRIFNLSLNTSTQASTDLYSPEARILDEIAEENDIIFVISAGNTDGNDTRREWPKDRTEAIQILASTRNDTIRTPSESCKNICVSALNPPNLDGIIPFALSNYSCRGPSLRVGVKPDIAHVGGSGTWTSNKGHGLMSIDVDGKLIDQCGTSFAAPHVAKTLAMIDLSIDGNVSRETLQALLYHHAMLPDVLSGKEYTSLAKHLVGFGKPKSAYDTLNGENSSITLVFANRVRSNQKMSFDFAWPSVLVRDRKCFGYAKLTVVASVPFNHNYGAEFIRVNLEGFLRQDDGNGHYLGRLKPIHKPNNLPDTLLEKSRISHSNKWSQIKKYDRNFRGVGNSTNWRLELETTTRDRESVPSHGIPFSAILTITDTSDTKNVFDSMKQSLLSRNIDIHDIRTASKVMPRV